MTPKHRRAAKAIGANETGPIANAVVETFFKTMKVDLN